MSQKIQELENKIEELGNLYFKKQDELRKLKYDSDFVEFKVFYTINGEIGKKSVAFERGSSVLDPSFASFLRHAAIIEIFRAGGGTHLDYLIDEYAEKFNISEDEKKDLMQKYWYGKKKTVNEYFTDLMNSYFESANVDRVAIIDKQLELA